MTANRSEDWLAVQGYLYHGYLYDEQETEVRARWLGESLEADFWGGGKGFYGTTVHFVFAFDKPTSPLVDGRITWHTDLGPRSGEVTNVSGSVSISLISEGLEIIDAAERKWDGRRPVQISFSLHGDPRYEHDDPTCVHGSFTLEPGMIETGDTQSEFWP